MKKNIFLPLVFLEISTLLSQAFGAEQFVFPCGNFGIDRASSEISSAKEKFYGKTGITLSYDYYADVFTNLSGGKNHGTNYTHIMVFEAVLDLEKIAGVKNAEITVSGAYNSGKDLSKKIGNFFTISESSVTKGWMFYELYYKQKFELNETSSLSFKAGRISMSEDFASIPIFGNLSAGAMDSTPEAIFFASPYTSSTLASWGFALSFETAKNITLSWGLYQAPSNINDPNWDGLDFGISKSDGYMMMLQLSWSPTFFGNLQGLYQVGGYFFDGYDMPLLKNSNESQDDGYGFYMQAQQAVWVDSNNPNRSITIWLGAQFAPKKRICDIVYQAYAGAQFQGFLPFREQDSVFISWTSGWFSKDYNSGKSDCETIFELNYLWQLNQNISLQPVLQYVMKPNGNSDIKNALVLGGQVMVSF